MAKIAPAVAASEKEYQAQDDAATLIRAAEIKQDPARLKAAKEILVQKKKAHASAMQDAVAPGEEATETDETGESDE